MESLRFEIAFVSGVPVMSCSVTYLVRSLDFGTEPYH